MEVVETPTSQAAPQDSVATSSPEAEAEAEAEAETQTEQTATEPVPEEAVEPASEDVAEPAESAEIAEPNDAAEPADDPDDYFEVIPPAEPLAAEDSAEADGVEIEIKIVDAADDELIVDVIPPAAAQADAEPATDVESLLEQFSDPDANDGAIADEPVAAPVARAPRTPKKRRPSTRTVRVAPPASAPVVLDIDSIVKRYGDKTAVDGVSLQVREGSFYGIVGPNGAGKTTSLSIITGLLRPDSGAVHVRGIDVWKKPRDAKRATGVLPDRLRLFDRLTGSQLLYYSGVLRGLDPRTVRARSADLATALGLEDAVDRLVADYSAGMTKKIALACAMIHSPRLLVLDEPFESVDPVSAANVIEILERYVDGGGTVVLSSHGMELIERVCDSVAIIVEGKVLASGTLDEVRGSGTLEDRFVELAGGRKAAEGMEWLHSFSD
ncbi:ATP-binding cassette domain-containing protein [Agromyces atrinae]|uniref:ABC transporter ATP-binding protein n=1 Tax=Agromyces atrinae TaxID=592376 RepID=UPI001F5A239A|nr:ABC transporter ATP-binding protein [Agromyces atrinae]MCI2959150.1 ATP-binding cassette domain-containing protein [Agromyces atrinae]